MPRACSWQQVFRIPRLAKRDCWRKLRAAKTSPWPRGSLQKYGNDSDQSRDGHPPARGGGGGGAGHSRRAAADRAVHRRASTAAGRAWPGQDAAGADDLQRDRPALQPRAVHHRPAALGHPRLGGARPAQQRISHAPWPDLHQPAARRRDQPRRAQGAERTARGDAGAQGHHRQRDAHAARTVPRHRHAKPDRAERHVRVAGGATRPLHALSPARLPVLRRGGGRAAAQPHTWPPADGRRRGAAHGVRSTR